MKIRKLATSTIWASVWFMFVGACLYCFLLFPARTVTLVGSSAHWKAEDVVHVQMLDRGWHESALESLTLSWTGADGAAIDMQYQLAGLHGMIAERHFSGSPPALMTDTRGTGMSGEEIKYGLFLTITWNGNSETLHLQRR